MQTLINDLLAYSRSSEQERQFEKTNLKVIIDEVKDDLREELQDKNARIDVGTMCEISVIPFQFRQLIINLVSNSLKFSNGVENPTIRISSTLGTGKEFASEKLASDHVYCHISIADNGMGFDQQYCEKIFAVFQRLNAKEDVVGTGIGLAIVKKIVDNHKGIISAEGKINAGATFNIYIPAHLP